MAASDYIKQVSLDWIALLSSFTLTDRRPHQFTYVNLKCLKFERISGNWKPFKNEDKCFLIPLEFEFLL